MNITRSMLNKAVTAKILTEAQADELIEFMSHLPEQNPKFDFSNVLYYLGGLIAMAAMSLFMGLGWSIYGDWGILILSLSYAILGIALTLYFEEQGNRIPAGICATFVVALTPLVIYGLLHGMGWWLEPIFLSTYPIHNPLNFLYMELGTLIVGITMAIIYGYPFIMMPIAVSLWFLSGDIGLIIGVIKGQSIDYVQTVLTFLTSMYLGLVILLVAFWVDMRTKSAIDYAFWLYLFGVITFWSGLTGYYAFSKSPHLMYMCINLVLLLLGVALYRTVFLIFGGLGVCIYLAHLTYSIFKFSYLFPVVLTLIGFGIIYLGILWQMHGTFLTQKIRSKLPEQIRNVLKTRDNL